MRLRAKVKRETSYGMKVFCCEFPKGKQWPFFMPESILKRNLGERPYAEASFVNDEGCRVVIYMK